MTTVWRPRVRIPVPDIDDADARRESERRVDDEGHEAEESPSNEGAVRARGEEALGRARCAVGVRTDVSALECKECGGASICEHGRQRYTCKECGGRGICEHGRRRSLCKECGGGSICEHGRQRSKCKECGGGSICEHGRRRSECKECGGGQCASTVVGACMQGVRWVTNMRARSCALSMQGVWWEGNMRARSSAL